MNWLRLRPRSGRGFTLVELLVVIVIIALISAVALPVVLPALDERRVSEAARELQGALSGARDAAIRANAPRGIRLLPDPVLSPAPYGNAAQGVLASNRYVAIEPGPDYSEGMVVAYFNATTSPTNPTFLQVNQAPTSVVSGTTLPNEPTGWYFNIRQGDKIRFNDSGAYYTIAGPMTVGPSFSNANGQVLANGQQNSERYINYGLSFVPSITNFEFLFLVNGVDDDGDGWIDESFDGIDNDGDGIVDPGFNGVDDNANGTIDEPAELFIGNEFEQEVFVGDPPSVINPSAYTILRRPVISPGTREVTLPDGIVIDMTTYDAASATPVNVQDQKTKFTIQFPERSRLPVDPYNFSVDILVSPSGQVVQAGAGAAGIEQNNSSPTSNLPFYHFWLTERRGVVAPLWGAKSTVPYVPALNPSYSSGITYLLPMPQGTINYSPSASQNPQYLTGERRLVTMFTRSGQVVTNSIQIFDGSDTNRPFYDAQAGIKESQ